MNARVDGIEVDAVWVDRRLVVELDSWTWHKTQPCFRADRAKSRRLTVLGWTVLRVTDAELDQEPLLIADEINALRAA
jgi:very-short-patch-repair endonuclease